MAPSIQAGAREAVIGRDGPAPLIVTLGLAESDQARLDGLRRTHFPPERNLVPAHVTLFHHLPGDQLDAVGATLREAADRQASFAVLVSGVRSLGRGVALVLDSPSLSGLRGRIAGIWSARLTPQDRQAYRPHVTIQNKVDPATARALLARLQTEFAPFTLAAIGLRLWRYQGGPWTHEAMFPFAAGDASRAPDVRSGSEVPLSPIPRPF